MKRAETESSCAFCDIVAGDAAAEVIYTNATTVAFLDNTAVTTGHTLVIPRTHVADIWDISAADVTAVMATAHRVAHLIRASLNPDGLTLFQANRPAGWQDVFHFHLHVVPRFQDDRLSRPWTAEFADRAELRKTREALLGGSSPW
jgi:histidine triad (HIT) family protein